MTCDRDVHHRKTSYSLHKSVFLCRTYNHIKPWVERHHFACGKKLPHAVISALSLDLVDCNSHAHFWVHSSFRPYLAHPQQVVRTLACPRKWRALRKGFAFAGLWQCSWRFRSRAPGSALRRRRAWELSFPDDITSNTVDEQHWTPQDKCRREFKAVGGEEGSSLTNIWRNLRILLWVRMCRTLPDTGSMTGSLWILYLSKE